MNVLGKVSPQIIGSPTVPSDEHGTCQCNTSLGLTANQHGRCHGSHSAWRVIQVQHVSRHLVKLVHCILKHEGHDHIGDLGKQRDTFREEAKKEMGNSFKQPIRQTYAQYSPEPFFQPSVVSLYSIYVCAPHVLKKDGFSDVRQEIKHNLFRCIRGYVCMICCVSVPVCLCSLLNWLCWCFLLMELKWLLRLIKSTGTAV